MQNVIMLSVVAPLFDMIKKKIFSSKKNFYFQFDCFDGVGGILCGEKAIPIEDLNLGNKTFYGRKLPFATIS
jgi:hypothetical protein